MAAKVKVDQIETVDGTGNITLNNSITMASNKTLPAASLTGTIASFTSTGIDDNATSTAITIDSSENVGIGVVPETWHGGYTALQVDALSLMCHKTTPTVHTMGNAYHNGSNYKYVITGVATQHSMEGGDHVFRTAASGSADANITWTDQLSLKADGRGLSQFTAKVWARFNGSGTPAFGDSHNCSSITDNSTGNYTINFTNNLANVNYSLTTASQNWSIASNEWRLVSPYSMAVGSVGIQTVESYGGDLRLVDHTECMLQIFGD